jgi:hypothetical protein
MSFKSYSEIRAENRKPMATPCTQDEMDAKLREIKIAKVLGEDTEELVEWIYSHYVPSKSTFKAGGGLSVKNPMATAVINIQ